MLLKLIYLPYLQYLFTNNELKSRREVASPFSPFQYLKYLFNKLNKTVRNSTVEFTGHSQQRFPDTVPRIQSSLDNETKRQGLEKIQNKIAVRCSQKETRKKRKEGKRMKKLAKIGKSSASRRTKISCHVLP